MFEVRYIKNDVVNKHIDVTPDTLLDLLKAHRDKEITILNVEDTQHRSFNFESLITNLKL